MVSVLILSLLMIEEPKHKVFLPVIYKSNTMQVWVNLESVSPSTLQHAIVGSGIAVGISWSNVEYVKGEYDWSRYDSFFQLSEWPIAIQIKNSPLWARTIEKLPCSPPELEYYGDYAKFVVDVIERYHPVRVDLWNEPDVAPENVSPLGSPFGCWGEDYAGGYAYGEFIDTVYPLIKADEPNVTILAGSLMLDEGKNDFATGFTDATEQYDILGFHSYSHYPWKDYEVPFRKAAFLSTLTDRPLALSETSYLCDLDCGTVFEQEQAEYLEYVNARIKEHGILFFQWYTLSGNSWRNSDMVVNDRRKPVWYKYSEILGY